jgi:putative ABC transport system substrate-binding protein
MEVSQAANAIIDNVDILLLPSDNTVWSAMEKLVSIAKAHQVPIFTSDPDSCARGVTVALGYAQYDVGYDAGKKLVKVLAGELPAHLAVTAPEKKLLYINADMAQDIHLTIPDNLLQKADVIISTRGRSS